MFLYKRIKQTKVRNILNIFARLKINYEYFQKSIKF